ncbi:MAG: APC family permease [Anaerohalosphaeraceae bacterium]|jgi:amino acid transporter
MAAPQPQKMLSVFDSVCIIVGIIIGAGIYETAPLIASCMGTGLATLAIWLLGGLIALAGALNYSELATTYPRQGGDYVYLTRAFGRPMGFLFGWTQLVIIRPGDIALMAFIFGRYGSTLYSFAYSKIVYAISAIVVLSLINMLSVRQTKWTQNALTVIKIVGLGGLITAGLWAPYDGPAELPVTEAGAIPLALILVLYTFGGWNEMAYVAAEVKQPQRNISRALVLGTLVVTVLYLLVNGAFLNALGYSGVATSEAVATETIAGVFSQNAGRFISILICISTLGAVNGLIFTGARISYALGTEHQFFGLLGRWHSRFGTPIWALILQGGLALGIIGFAGSFLDTILYTAPVVWVFFLGTCLSVWILRRKDRHAERGYKVPLYPVPTLVFGAACVFMLYSSVVYALRQKPAGFCIAAGCFLLGGIVYAITQQKTD